MILYFDSYITDIPLTKRNVVANDPVRNSCHNYLMPRKVDVAKYVLASYASYDWSHVLIRYELDDPAEYLSFDEYILQLFPKAQIMHERSDSQNDFKQSLKIINDFGDDWIFYAGNNDHPLVTSDISIIDELVSRAKKYEDKYDYLSVVYSHLSEFINLPKKGSVFNLHHGSDVEVLEEDDLATVILRKNGDNSAIQIVNKRLLNYWFNSSRNFGLTRIIRSEDVRGFLITHNQVMVIPKREVCAHFDGCSHLCKTSSEIEAYQVAPLIIPPAFFESNIKISFGYNLYREGWLNINPLSKKYIFEDGINGTDLKISIEDIPIFWKDRISIIDQNKEVDVLILKNILLKNKYKYLNPWSFASKKININTLMWLCRFLRFKFQFFFLYRRT